MLLAEIEGLESLTAVNGRKGCFRLKNGGRCDFEDFVVEPGDGTHYEVAVRGDMCIATTGSLDGDCMSGVVVHARSGNFNLIGGRPSEYTRNVCLYFARLALGLRTQEPEELSSRREVPHG